MTGFYFSKSNEKWLKKSINYARRKKHPIYCASNLGVVGARPGRVPSLYLCQNLYGRLRRKRAFLRKWAMEPKLTETAGSHT